MVTTKAFVLAIVVTLLAAACAGVLAVPVFQDNFDDGIIDSTVWWTGYPEHSNWFPTYERNGRLEVEVPPDMIGPNHAGGYYSKQKLRGNFDIQVDYEILEWPANGAIFALTVHDWSIERHNRGADALVAHFGVDSTAYWIPCSSREGSLRLIRRNDLLAGYYWDTGDWKYLYSWHVGTFDADFFGLTVWGNDYYTGQTMRIAFDNFVLSEGQLVPPIPEPSGLIAMICGLAGVVCFARRP